MCLFRNWDAVSMVKTCWTHVINSELCGVSKSNQRRGAVLKLNLRQILLGPLFCAMLMGCFEQTIREPKLVGDWPTLEWERTTPEAQGIDSADLARIVTSLNQQQGVIHSLMLVRHGAVVLDAYFHPYDGSTSHDVASVTKSVTTTLLGVALHRGDLQSLDLPIIEVLGRNEAYPNLGGMSIGDVASMRSGLDCGLRGDERELMEMIQSDNWIEFTLQLPVVAEPGSQFGYCSSGMHLLSAVISQVTGSNAATFAEDALFVPLGINAVSWPEDEEGISLGWGDLGLHPLDMAKLGLLYLHDGVWDGQRLLPEGWVHDAVEAKGRAENGDGYGFGWWRPAGFDGVFAANGRGGQTISVLPALDLIVVVTGSGFDLGSIAPDLIGSIKSDVSITPSKANVQKLNDIVKNARLSSRISDASYVWSVDPALIGKRFELSDNDLGVMDVEIRQPREGFVQICLGMRGLQGRTETSRPCFATRADGTRAVSEYGLRPNYDIAARVLVNTAGDFSVELAETSGPNRVKLIVKPESDRQISVILSEATGLFPKMVLVGTKVQS